MDDDHKLTICIDIEKGGKFKSYSERDNSGIMKRFKNVQKKKPKEKPYPIEPLLLRIDKEQERIKL